MGVVSACSAVGLDSALDALVEPLERFWATIGVRARRASVTPCEGSRLHQEFLHAKRAACWRLAFVDDSALLHALCASSNGGGDFNTALALLPLLFEVCFHGIGAVVLTLPSARLDACVWRGVTRDRRYSRRLVPSAAWGSSL